MIKEILRNRNPEQTVFTLADIACLTGKLPGENLIALVSYYVKKKELLRISKGLYALSSNYSLPELANKLRTPSYISFYTVLLSEGVIFQPYKSIFAAASRSEIKRINGEEIIYRKLKEKILFNPLGLVQIQGVMYAMVERALSDTIYLDGLMHFDNLRRIDWRLMRKLSAEVYQKAVLNIFINKAASVN